ncbi:hypothetical protein StoSoilB5_40850 [Arthrobacter sp. StoSoilB5]|nr:hypothetical protein StoSoilB5_40850 [Arthrobacter sp. StoSoilB5]
MLGLIAVIVGLIVAWKGKDEPIGWFSYAPLSNQTFVANGTAFISQGTQLGLAVAVLGLLILAFWAGHTVGRRR